jgi:hypothetical protein
MTDDERAEIVRSILQSAIPECEVQSSFVQPQDNRPCVQFTARCRVGDQLFGTVLDIPMETIRDEATAKHLAAETSARWADQFAELIKKE